MLIRWEPSCLVARNAQNQTPLDKMRGLDSHPRPPHVRVQAENIIQYLVKSYAKQLLQAHGSMCLHFLFGQANTASADDNSEGIQLPIGFLEDEKLQLLVEQLVTRQPDSVSTLNSNGELPLQVAQSKMPVGVIHSILRRYPEGLIEQVARDAGQTT